MDLLPSTMLQTNIPFESKQISRDLSQNLYNVTTNIAKVNITLDLIEFILCNSVIICILIIFLLIYWNIKMFLSYTYRENDFTNKKLNEREKVRKLQQKNMAEEKKLDATKEVEKPLMISKSTTTTDSFPSSQQKHPTMRHFENLEEEEVDKPSYSPPPPPPSQPPPKTYIPASNLSSIGFIDSEG